MTSVDLKYITRFEFGRTRAWWVRIQRLSFNKTKLFSDKAYGGKRKALLAAMKYRDAILKKAPKKKHAWSNQLNAGGYRRHDRYVQKNGQKVYRIDSWTAWIRTAPYKPQVRSWSIETLGVREAKHRMLEWLSAKQKEQKRNYRGRL